MNYGIIYRVISPSGKIYIGQTQYSLHRRKRTHISNAFSIKSKHYNSKFCKAIRKYGDSLVWEVLHNNIPIDRLHEIEIQEIVNHGSFNNGYNSTLGGKDAGFRGRHHKESTKAKLSELKKDTKNPMYGKSGILNPFYNQKHSLESKLKMQGPRLRMTGKNNPMFGLGGMLGKKHSEETKEKMRQKALLRRRNNHGKFS